MSSSTSPSSATSSILPTFHLLCLDQRFPPAFLAAEKKFFPNFRSHYNPGFTIHTGNLEQLIQYNPDLRISAVVSPANSYARLDGAFDDALAKAFAGPEDDYDWITRIAQKKLYELWRGFAPPGTCTVVDLSEEQSATHDNATSPQREQSLDDSVQETFKLSTRNPFDIEYLLLCPTMRIPQSVTWDNEIVFECVWSMLCAVENHNLRAASDASAARRNRISTVLMTPLATGVGRIKPQRWAEQCVLALKQYVEATEQPDIWQSLSWDKILEDHAVVATTYDQAV